MVPLVHQGLPEQTELMVQVVPLEPMEPPVQVGLTVLMGQVGLQVLMEPPVLLELTVLTVRVVLLE
jgi:hypothetical protein